MLSHEEWANVYAAYCLCGLRAQVINGILMQVCKVEKSFGEAKSKILHVFDPKVEAEDGQPASSLAQYLEKQLGELLPMLGVKPLQVCSSQCLLVNPELRTA